MKEVARQGDMRMTIRDFAQRLGCSPEAIKKHVRDLFPDLMQNGKTTWLDGKQQTIILEKMKQASGFAHHVTGGNVKAYNSGIAGTETVLTPMLRLKILHEEMEKIYNAEIAKLKAANEAQAIRLSEAEEWYSVKRVLIATGKKYPWKPLKEWSFRYGYEIKKVFDQNYEEVNAYHIDVWNAVYGLEL
jgi:DNA-binding Lrp family transcriptional regulator